MKRLNLVLLIALFAGGCATYAAYFTAYPINEKKWTNEYAKKDFLLSSGVHMKYHDVGPKEGKTLLLIHGMGDSSRSWYLIGPDLLKEYRLIAPDLTGHGMSEHPNCCYALDFYEQEIMELMENLKIEKAVVVGHDMGSFVAQRIAIDHPERVEKLILISSSDTGADNKELDYVSGVVQTQKGPADPSFTAHWFSVTTVLPIPDPLKERVKTEREAISKDVWAGDVKIMMNGNPKDQLSKLTMPTMIMWGDKDHVFQQADQDRLKAAIPNSQFKEYAGAGHTIQWEKPVEVVADVKAFVGQ